MSVRPPSPRTSPPAQRGEREKGVLVLCLGNPLRRDDAVALRVAEALEEDPPPGAAVLRSGRAGLYLVDEMEGFDRVVVVDAVRTGLHPPGTVHALPLEDLRAPAGPSPHALGLPSALELARRAGAAVPSRVSLVLVEVEVMDEVGEGLTPAVAAAVSAACRAAREAVRALSAAGSRRASLQPGSAISASRRGRGGPSAAPSGPRRRGPSRRVP